MGSLRIEGYVIVSADGRLTDANHAMPDALRFEGDKRFFTAGLDRSAVIVHGRKSYEDQPNSPKRKRIIVTRKIAALDTDPTNEKAVLWNPDGASFEAACARAGAVGGVAAVIGGPAIFGMFMDRYDTFWLSQAPRVRLPDGDGCFPGVPEKRAEEILLSHGLKPEEVQILDAANHVLVTAWRRAG